MALASKITYIDYTRRRKRRSLTITPSGNYVVGGDTLDLTKTTNPNFIASSSFAGVPQNSISQNAPGGYTAEFIPGATLAACKVKYYASDGTELAAGAYPAALTGDLTKIEVSTDTYTDR